MRAIFTSQQTIAVEGFRVVQHRRADVEVTVYARVSDQDGEQGVSIALPLTMELAEVLRLKLDRLARL
jgi:hypothetical protein